MKLGKKRRIGRKYSEVKKPQITPVKHAGRHNARQCRRSYYSTKSRKGLKNRRHKSKLLLRHKAGNEEPGNRGRHQYPRKTSDNQNQARMDNLPSRGLYRSKEVLPLQQIQSHLPGMQRGRNMPSVHKKTD